MTNFNLSPAEEKALKRLQEKQRKLARQKAVFWKQVEENKEEIIAHFAEEIKRAASQAEQHVNTGSTTGYQRPNEERNEQ